MTKNISRRNVMALLSVAPLVGAAVVRGETPKPAAGTKAEDIASRDRIRQRHFPNVQLTTHEGKKVRFYDDLIKDKIVVINFMYADCAGVCPRMTSNLVRVQEMLGARVGRDVHMYSFTLKPRQDTPAALHAYARMHGVRPGWLFLTGTAGEIETLRRALGFYDSDPVRDRDIGNHIGMVLFGNEALDRWASCPAIAEPSELARLVTWMDNPGV